MVKGCNLSFTLANSLLICKFPITTDILDILFRSLQSALFIRLNTQKLVGSLLIMFPLSLKANDQSIICSIWMFIGQINVYCRLDS